MLFCIGVWDILWGGKFPFVDTETVKWKRGPNGYAASAKATGGGGGLVDGHIRGEWNPDMVTSQDDIVTVSSGVNAGSYAYISETPTAGNDPTVGGGFWLQVGDFSGKQWM